LLETQLLLKGICTRAEWQQIKEEISYDFQKDMHFVELKEAELMKERLGILSDIDNYNGKYFSKAWIRKNVLRQSEDDIEEIDKEIEEESANEEDEIPPMPAPAPAPSPFAVPSQPIPVVIAKEETEPHIVDDTDQKELAKSMTKFFDTLVEEAKGDKEVK
jgi:hypothetical protein